MQPFLEACRDANTAIAAHLASGLDASMRHKSGIGAGGDVSSGIDLMAEAIFVEYLGRFGTIESEESGRIGSGEHTILLDPIDGSSNLLSGFPYYGTSAALIDTTGTTVAACICNLVTGEIFFKAVGTPAQRGSILDDTLSPYPVAGTPEVGIFERAYAHPDAVRVLGEMDLKFRAPGAVALSLVYALHSRFFLYIGKYRAYDFAAGLLFCEDLPRVQTEEMVVIARDREVLEGIVSQLGLSRT